MGRPSQNRVMYSIYLSRPGLAALKELAKERKQTTSETMRAALRYAMEHREDWT